MARIHSTEPADNTRSRRRSQRDELQADRLLHLVGTLFTLAGQGRGNPSGTEASSGPMRRRRQRLSLVRSSAGYPPPGTATGNPVRGNVLEGAALGRRRPHPGAGPGGLKGHSGGLGSGRLGCRPHSGDEVVVRSDGCETCLAEACLNVVFAVAAIEGLVEMAGEVGRAAPPGRENRIAGSSRPTPEFPLAQAPGKLRQ